MTAVSDYLNPSESLTFRFASALRAGEVGGFVDCLTMDEVRAFAATAAAQMAMIAELSASAVGNALYARGEAADAKGYERLADVYYAALLEWNGASRAYRRELACERLAA